MVETVTFEIWRKIGKKASKVDDVTAVVDWTERTYPEPGRIDVVIGVGQKWHESAPHVGCITMYSFDVDTKRITYSWDDCPHGGGCPNCFPPFPPAGA